MSSPNKRRTALAGKSTNIRANPIHKGTQFNSSLSPSKRSHVNVGYALRHSPVRNVPSSSIENTPSPALPFIIHEETSEERATTLINHMSLTKTSSNYHDENDFSGVKENMSPSKLNKKAGKLSITQVVPATAERRPLQNLSISEHMGYVEDPRTRELLPLTLHYTRKTILPSFVTPPRDERLKNYFSITAHEDNHAGLLTSRSTDDIPKDKVIRKLEFKICEN
ncbi:ACM1 (YPL267W) [Zygosaccharomyces parabailii]|nr:ACM1 (YPL267W) [Zygosaccharomyces parabailii]CDH11764.1 related to APC/C-CDH1 modulator 1 [Zygosaccharomyces bailii ISA1307]